MLKSLVVLCCLCYNIISEVKSNFADILMWYIYKHPECKQTFQEALKLLLRSASVVDVPLAYLYIYTCLVIENRKTVPFKLDLDELRPLFAEAVKRHSDALS